ncbi:hypothetical protein [Enterovibrio paralichthyis]|uniref:hypothetical protein n=1 Tax=Enterovibrio paralichthyis TaxID=2853805 RepID=UPI001C47C8A4|nr:hypothetical protein [Enterovibrio paralichthyis]MBV7300734.1 hypothetical protein [Enterovibrio paralichthyis]
MKKLLVIFSALAISACASNQLSLQVATASHFDNVVASDVALSNIDRGVLTVTWNAEVNGKQYYCEADDMVKRSSCKEI